MDRTLYITAKIKKLLALATSPNQHEAQRALAKAQQLMLEYNLENIVFESEDKKACFKKIVKFWEGQNLTSEAWVIGSLAEEYCCTYDTLHEKAQTSIVIFGNEVDVEVAACALIFAWKAFKRCWREYYTKQTNKRKIHRSKLRVVYCVGFVHGILSANLENREANALVVVIPDNAKTARLEHHRSELIALGIDPDKPDCPAPVKPRKPKKKKPVHMDMDAYRNGYIKGRTAKNGEQLTILDYN